MKRFNKAKCGQNFKFLTKGQQMKTKKVDILEFIKTENMGECMNNLTYFLKENITNTTSLENIVNIFEQMCKISVEEDMILFETGTFSISKDEQMFQISLVRQFPNEDEEFYQVRVDILYEPDNENKMFNEAVWNEDLSENIFDYIRNSKIFTYAKNKDYHKVKIWCDKT